jgi:lipid-binding SYLF domain-containing protein
MKKVFPLLFAALVCAAVPRAQATEDRPTLVKEVESCEAIIREFQADPSTAIPARVLQSAHALIIVNQFKASLILGIKGGYGVILVKKAGGNWSVPVLLRANEASFGLQIGAKTVETVYVLTDAATPRLLFRRQFNSGVDAKAEIGPHGAEAENDNHPIIDAPILVYTKSAGLFAGATVKAAQLSRDDESNYELYRTTNTMPELLYSDWVTPPPEVQPLMAFVAKIAP